MADGTITRKRGRPPGGRAFDYDLARQLHAGGMTTVELGRMFDVQPKAIRHALSKPLTLKMEGPVCPITDARWRALEEWIKRRQGDAGGYSRQRVQSRTMIPRSSR